MLAASRCDCNEEGHHPQDDDSDCDPADYVEFAAAEYPPIEKANGEFQESEGYRVYQVKGGLQLVRINHYVHGSRRYEQGSAHLAEYSNGGLVIVQELNCAIVRGRMPSERMCCGASDLKPALGPQEKLRKCQSVRWSRYVNKGVTYQCW